jgi:hypothetical protein
LTIVPPVEAHSELGLPTVEANVAFFHFSLEIRFQAKALELGLAKSGTDVSQF